MERPEWLGAVRNWLLNYEIDVDLRKAPITEACEIQIIQSSDWVDHMLHNMLEDEQDLSEEGLIEHDYSGHTGECVKLSKLVKYYEKIFRVNIDSRVLKHRMEDKAGIKFFEGTHGRNYVDWTSYRDFSDKTDKALKQPTSILNPEEEISSDLLPVLSVLPVLSALDNNSLNTETPKTDCPEAEIPEAERACAVFLPRTSSSSGGKGEEPSEEEIQDYLRRNPSFLSLVPLDTPEKVREYALRGIHIEKFDAEIAARLAF
jgi:hypothetical protein